MLGLIVASPCMVNQRHPAVYRRRRPEETVLHRVICRDYLTFKASVEENGRSLPAFVEREFEKFIDCGSLAKGFVRCRCPACGYDRLVAFSCKCRGWCPSCVGRRMADTAAYLTDHVIPNIPTRTWTLTVPQPLRYLLAYNADILSEVNAAFKASLFEWLRWRAKDELGLKSVNQARPGLITWIQRFGSAVNLNVHIHGIATEGVFVDHGDEVAQWCTVSAPSSDDVAQIAWATCQRVVKALQRRGVSLMGEDADIDELAEREPLLAACYAASIKGFIATGRRAGQRMMQMGVPVADHGDGRRRGPAHGFDVFAGRCIGAPDRTRREHAIRYMTRPPLPEKRLSIASNGDVVVELKRAWANGTTHVRLAGIELIERLVSLVPPPRVNLVRYSGVFAPNAGLRAAVVARARIDSGAGAGACKHKTGRYHDWAKLMARVFEIDVTRCPRCGEKGMQHLATITKRDAIAEILDCVGEPTGPPCFAPARYEDPDVDFAA